MKMSSHAVRAQRVEPRTSLDDFPTPCWGTRSLVEEVLAQTDIGVPEGRVFEPTANRGYMSRALKEYWPDVTTSDIFDYRPDPETIDPQDHVGDFLAAGETVATTAEIIISNPPFKAAQAFITRALALPDWRVVAMLTRSSFVEGETRYRELFADGPPQVHMPVRATAADHQKPSPQVEAEIDDAQRNATEHRDVLLLAGLVARCARRLGRSALPIHSTLPRPARTSGRLPGRMTT